MGNVFDLNSFGAATIDYASTLTTNVVAAATMSSPSFTIKGGASEAKSAITVAAAGITVGAGTNVPTSDPVTINSNVFDLNSFGAATIDYASTLTTNVASTLTTTVDAAA